MAGCSLNDSSKEDPAPDIPTIISENTIVLDGESLDTITVNPEDPLILTFTNPPPHSVVHRLKAGDIIVAGPHRNVPTGFLRRIENVDHDDTKVIIRTTHAQLDDAIEQCRIRETVPIKFADVPLTGYKDTKGTTYIEIKGDEIKFTKAMVEDGVRLYVSQTLTPTAVLELDIDKHGLHYFMFKLVFESDTKGGFSIASDEVLDDLLENLGLIDNLNWLNVDGEIPINIGIPAVFVMIGVVPVVICPDLALEYGWEFKLYGSCEMSVKKSLTFEAGFKYEDKKVSPIKYFSQDPLTIDISTSAGAMFRPYVGPKFTASFYDCGGPYINFHLFGEIDGHVSYEGSASSISTESQASLNLTLYGGMECFVGIDLNDRFMNLIGEEAEDILEGLCSKSTLIIVF